MDFSLETIGLGAVSERFEEEMEKLIENVLDPNTDIKKIREITIKLKIKPALENRERCSLETIVSSKLAPAKALASHIHIGISADGEMNAVEDTPRQGNLFPDPDPKSNVRDMKKAANQ